MKSFKSVSARLSAQPYLFNKVALGLAILLCLRPSFVSAQTNSLKITKANAKERFDDSVRDDFFSNDPAIIQRGMKRCEAALLKDPKNAPALCWHGAGILREAGQYFQNGDAAKGVEYWRRGLKEMNDAVTLEPENIEVLIPRAATLLGIAKYVPDQEESRRLLNVAISDYEKVSKLQQPYFKTLPLHSRGELLSALAEGWFRLGNQEKAGAYLVRITNECAGSTYAKNAASWMANPVIEMKRKPETLTCIGCHDR